MLSDLRDWGFRVGHHWRYLVTGSLLAAIYIVGTIYTGKSLPWSVALWILLAFALWASFLAWRDKNYELRESGERVKGLELERSQLGSELAAALSAKSIVKLPAIQKRIYVEHSIEELSKMFEGVTTDEGQARVEKYLGKWKRVSGAFSDRTKYPDGYTVTIAQTPLKGPYLLMNFETTWNDRVAILKPGQAISVEGKIRRIERNYVWLEKCDLA